MSMKNDVPVFPPFNPLDKRNLGESAASALLGTEVYALPPDPFIGAGVYALYYTGDLPIYSALTAVNADGQYTWPIYVGKAVPDGARKGGQGDCVNPGAALYKRLNDHAKSIDAARDLDIEDFHCRFLSVDDIWIPLTESLMIERFRPVWNVVVDGFGNHDPGKGRHRGRRPFWDQLHPGRAWADRLQPCDLTKEELERRVRSYLSEMIHKDGPRTEETP